MVYASHRWLGRSEKNKWKFVQFLFSLLSATAIGLAIQGNYLALPCLVITMRKCGFPGEILRPDNFTELIHYNKSLTLPKQPFGQVFLYHLFFQETVLLIYSALYEIKNSFIERFFFGNDYSSFIFCPLCYHDGRSCINPHTRFSYTRSPSTHAVIPTCHWF